MQAANGWLAFNHPACRLAERLSGAADHEGVQSTEAEEAVGIKILQANPLTRAIMNTDADRCRITVLTPALSDTNTSSSNIEGDEVEYQIQVAPNLKPFQLIGNFRNGRQNHVPLQAGGMCSTTYQLRPLANPRHAANARGTGPTDPQNLYWDAYTMIIDDRVNYTRSACVGTLINAAICHNAKRALSDRWPAGPHPERLTIRSKPPIPAFRTRQNQLDERPGMGFLRSRRQQPLRPRQLHHVHDDGQNWALCKMAQFCGPAGFERQGQPNGALPAMSRSWTAEAFDLLTRSPVYLPRLFLLGGAGSFLPSPTILPIRSRRVLRTPGINGNFTYSGGDIRARHTIVKPLVQYGAAGQAAPLRGTTAGPDYPFRHPETR